MFSLFRPPKVCTRSEHEVRSPKSSLGMFGDFEDATLRRRRRLWGGDDFQVQRWLPSDVTINSVTPIEGNARMTLPGSVCRRNVVTGVPVLVGLLGHGAGSGRRVACSFMSVFVTSAARCGRKRSSLDVRVHRGTPCKSSEGRSRGCAPTGHGIAGGSGTARTQVGPQVHNRLTPATT